MLGCGGGSKPEGGVFLYKKYYINIFLCKNYVQIFGYGKERDSANADSVTMMYRAISV